MSLIQEIKKASLEGGMPTELADKIAANLETKCRDQAELEELLDIAKRRKPSHLVWCFLDWSNTKEGVAHWARHAHNLEEAEYNSAKTESV